MDEMGGCKEEPLCFLYEKHDYVLDKALNNKNRWHNKLVCSIFDSEYHRYVATTYRKSDDYREFIETTGLLKRNSKLYPRIFKLYAEENTVICEHIGEFLSEYLIQSPSLISSALSGVFDYLVSINSIAQNYKSFIIPSIVEASLELPDVIDDRFEFLSETKSVLSKLRNSQIKFSYGCGIEDPHIWNFRIVTTSDSIQALTTDFDFFAKNVNCFWEFGYFYATFRWLKKTEPSMVQKIETIILSLIKNCGLKSEFMFWLGVLSSYCGYKDSLRNFRVSNAISELQEQHQLIQQLDKKIFCLAKKLLVDGNLFSPTPVLSF